MPKIAKELTALEVKRLGLGTHTVGGVAGLYLEKRENASYWHLRYLNSTGRHEFGLGSYPEVSLAAARQMAHEARLLIKQGIDPIEKRRDDNQKRIEAAAQAALEAEQKIQTFEKVANEWIEDRVKSGYWAKSLRGEKETRQILVRNVYPDLGAANIETITPDLVKSCLCKIWQSKPSTANKARSYTRKIFQWAIALEKRKNKENPADMGGTLGILMEAYQKNRKRKTNHAACPVALLPALMLQIHGLSSMSARATEFAILTASRSQAVRKARWDEFDLDKGVWTVPLDNDKVKGEKRDRTIFLSKQAVELLKGLVRFSETSLVFPSSQGRVMSDMTLSQFLRGLHEKKLEQDGIGWIDPVKSKLEGKPCIITPHGTARSTFRTWAKDDELGNNRRFDQEAAEMCLLHGKNDAYDGAYDRAKLVNERKLIMREWGKFCYSLISVKKRKHA